MKILFLGGNGNISWHCVNEALKKNHEVWELNREKTLNTRRNIQPEVHKLKCDIHDIKKMKQLLDGFCFDIVIDFICFNESDAKEAVDIFMKHTKCFIFISSDSVYKRSGKNLPFKENCEKYAPYNVDMYVGGKIMAEQVFSEAYKNDNFPITIIRPAYTYDTIIPVSVGHNCFTAPQKYIDGKPALIAGDGTNLWTFTHSSDFASALIALIDNPEIVGQAFNIASDEWLSWNEEMEILFRALSIKSYKAIHIPYDEALKITCFQSKDLMAQRMWHNIYDIKKIQDYVPKWKVQISFEEGIKKTIDWLMEKDIRRRYNERYDIELNKLYIKYEGEKNEM